MTAQRRKMLVLATALFTFGVAFAAEPTAMRTAASQSRSAGPPYWVPGSNIPMSAYEETPSLMPMPHDQHFEQAAAFDRRASPQPDGEEVD